MNKSVNKIFQDVPDDIDEGWRHGALLGGMATAFNQSDIARAYKAAGDVLAERCTREVEAYEVIYPLVFLYRHSLESYLKAIVEPEERNHGLHPLIEQLKNHILQKYNEILPSQVEAWLLEFDRADPGSSTFRYADTNMPDFNTDGECWVDIQNLKKVMDCLAGGFEKMLRNVI